MRILRGKDGNIQPWRVGIAILVILVILIPFCTGSRGLFTLIRLYRDVNRMEQELDRTTQENVAIADTIQALESGDPVALEYEARKLGMVKPGETVYRVVPENSK
jgi:cell division protein FtsB